MINPFSAPTRGLSRAIRGAGATLRGFSRTNPEFAIGTAVAALVAPMFLSDENRGYFQTATLTTPIIAALGMAAPRLIPETGAAARSGWGFIKSGYNYVKRTDNPFAYKELRGFTQSGIGSNTMTRVLSSIVPGRELDFLANRPGSIVKPFDDRIKDIRQIFGSMTSETNWEQNKWPLSYAFEKSRLQSLSPLQILNDPGRNLILQEPLSIEGMRTQIESAISSKNEGFLGRLEGQMRFAGHIRDMGPQAPAPALTGMAISPPPLDINMLWEQRPELAAILESKQGLLDNAKMVSYDLAHGKKLTQVILRKMVKGVEDELTIPIVDKASGAVHIGYSNRLAAARGVWQPTGPASAQRYDLDVWLGKYATETDNWRELRKYADSVVVGSVDKLNEWKFANSAEAADRTLREESIRMISKQYVVTPFADFGGKTWENLTNEEAKPWIDAIVDPASGWASPLNAEKNVIKGVFAQREIEERTFGRIASWERQSQAFRSFTKPMYLANVPEDLQPFVQLSTEAGETTPEMRQIIAGITPQEQTLFGMLPKEVTRLKDTDISARVIGSLRMENPLLTEASAIDIWKDMATELSKPGVLDAARLAGGLGETNLLMNPAVSGRVATQSRRWVTVDSLNVPSNTLFPPGQVIGWSAGDPVLTTAPMSQVVNTQENDFGRYEALVEESFNDATGRKFNAAGIKGTEIAAADAEQFNQFMNVINLKRSRTGGALIPGDVTAFVNELYFHDKLKEPAELIAEQGMELFNRAKGWEVNLQQDRELSEILTNYKTKMGQHQINFSNRGVYQEIMIEDTSALRGWTYGKLGERIRGIESETRSFAGQIADFARRRSRTSSELMTADERSFVGNILNDPLMGNFLTNPGDTHLLDYMFHNYMSVSLSMWADARMDNPAMNAITQPLLGELNRAGLNDTMRELMARAEYQHADPEGMAKFMEHLAGEDYTRPLGNVISWKDAVAGVNPRTPEGRVGFLNYNDPRFQTPFSIELEKPLEIEGKTYRFLPSAGMIPGGTGANIERPGVVHTSEYEKSLFNLTAATREGGEGFLKRLEEFRQTAAQQAFGKQGEILRPRAIDPGAVAGRSALIATENPFDVMIAPGALEHIKDKTIREALEAGTSYGIIERFPTQSAIPVRVNVARTGAEAILLGERMIGISNQLRPVLEADFDLDTLILHMMAPNSPAWKELQEATANTVGYSQMSVKNINWMYGNAEDPAFYAASEMRGKANPWTASLEKLIGTVEKPGGTVGSIAAVHERMSSRYIGAFSNLVTESQLMLSATPELMANPREIALMQHVLWLPRQGSIGAIKGTHAVGGDVNAAEGLLRTMRGGLRSGNTEAFMTGLETIAEGWKWKAAVTNETPDLLGMSRQELESALSNQVGRPIELEAAIANKDKFNIVQALVKSDRVRKDVEAMVTRSAPTGQVASMLRLLTQSSGNIDTRSIKDFLHVGQVAPEIQGWARRESSMAEVSANALGALNEAWSSITSKLGGPFKKTLPVLGVGLGIAALAGLAITPVGRKSANAYRPEELAGVQDRNPGQDVAGVMAPSAPPRRELPPRAQTRTAMVAPMRQAVDLEIRAAAEDRARSADLHKTVTQAAARGGSSYTTVNYIDGYNRLSKPRIRERIRELSDRD